MSLVSNIFKTNKANPEYKIGIALSGGGVRGIAHLGVLKALHENKIYPEIISGTSAGALAGIFYADGYTPDEAFEIFNDTNLFKFTQISLPRKGLLSIEKISKILKKHIKAKRFEDLKKPLYVSASNLNEGKVEYFHSGEIVEKVIASASIPVVFKPVIMNNTTYVDGGIFDNLPIEPIKNKCQKIIASHVNPQGRTDDLDSILKIAERTFHLAVGSNIDQKKDECDLFIESEDLKEFGILNISKAKEIFTLGYDSAIKSLEDNNPF